MAKRPSNRAVTLYLHEETISQLRGSEGNLILTNTNQMNSCNNKKISYLAIETNVS